MKVCTQCGTKLDKNDRFCPSCGSSMYEEKSMRSAKFCPSCGELLESKAKFCRKCGAACDDEKEKEKATLARFEAQIKARETEKRAQDELAAKIEKPVTIVKPVEENKAEKPAEIKKTTELVDTAKGGKSMSEDINEIFTEEELQYLTDEGELPEIWQMPSVVAEFEAEKEALAAAETAKLEAAQANNTADTADENAKKAEEAAKLARESAERAALLAKEAMDRADEAEKEAENKKEIAEKKRKELETIKIQEDEKRQAEIARRKEKAARLKAEEEERRRKEEAARIKALNDLHAECLKNANDAINKFDKSPEAGRSLMEAALDAMEDFYKKADPDMDLSDTVAAYEDMQERLGVMYYQEGAYKLAMPLIDAAVANGSKKAAIYKTEWYTKNRGEIPKEQDFLLNFAKDAMKEPTITKEEELLLYLAIAKAYHDGMSCKRDLNEAFVYYEKAADLGSAHAYAKIGQCYLYGEGVKKDGKLALEWSQKAADADSETGIRNVAVCYDFGTGTKKNADAAIEWYKKLLVKAPSDRFAMYRISHCIVDPDREYGRRATDEECLEAFEFASKAQAGGEENANYIMGYLCMMGKGVARDYNKAVSYFTSAANYGNSKAKDKIKLFVRNSNGTYSLK